MSIEPGYYEDGQFGIRIENLAFVTVDEKLSNAARTWYRFHPVTLCPIDRKLVDKKFMTSDQVVAERLPQAGVPRTGAGR